MPHWLNCPARARFYILPVFPTEYLAAATQYMLGSTKNWRPLANGYSGFMPPAVHELAAIPLFTEAFFGFLSARAPVEYVVLHGGKMDAAEYDASRRAANATPHLETVAEYGTTAVYRRVPQPRTGTELARRYAWSDVHGTPVSVEARSTRERPFDVEIRWGERAVGGARLTRQWQTILVPTAQRTDRRADGSIELSLRLVFDGHEQWTRPLGESGGVLQAEILVDAQADRLAVTLDDVWDVAHYGEPALLCVVIGDDGRDLRTSSVFPGDDLGIADLAAFVAGLPVGTKAALAAVSVNPSPGASAAALRTAIEALGGQGLPDGLSVERYALLGVRGATPGTAIEHHDLARAAVRATPVAQRLPTFELR